MICPTEAKATWALRHRAGRSRGDISPPSLHTLGRVSDPANTRRQFFVWTGELHGPADRVPRDARNESRVLFRTLGPLVTDFSHLITASENSSSRSRANAPVAGVDSLLPIERQSIGKFGDSDLGQQRLGRMPASMRWAGAGAWITPSRPRPRYAYLGRRMTITRNLTGSTSSRSEESSPIYLVQVLATGQVLGLEHHCDPLEMDRKAFSRPWRTGGSSRRSTPC